jgi:DNA-binding NarL/FixJ family response regulator
MSEPITVVLADDHPMFRRGLTDVIGAEPSFRIVGEAGDGETALALCRRHRPRVTVLDIDMPKMSGLAVADALRQEQLGAAVVILTMYREPAMFRRALDLGAQGYVLKDSAVMDIVACLHMVAAGRPYISPALSGELVERHRAVTVEVQALDDLTPAQRQVLKLIAQGLTTPAIAQALGISPKTVENHRLNICGRLGLHGPQALLRYALERKALLTGKGTP